MAAAERATTVQIYHTIYLADARGCQRCYSEIFIGAMPSNSKYYCFIVDLVN